MEKSFIKIRKQAKNNLGILSSLVIGVVLLFLGDLILVVIEELFHKLFAVRLFDSLEFQLFGFIFISLVVYLWAKYVEKTPMFGLGITKNNMLKDFLFGWVIGGGLLSLSVFIMMIFGVVKIAGFNFSINFLLHFLFMVILWSIQGSTEEFLTRGWMFAGMAAKRSVPIALIFSSLFFTIMHLGNDGIDIIPLIDLFFFGLLAALFMLKTNSIWMSCGIHAAWNCFQGNVFKFPVSGMFAGDAFIDISISEPNLLSGGSFGVEGSIISVVLQGIFIILLIYDIFYREKRKNIS